MKQSLSSEITFAQNAIENSLRHTEISRRLAEHRIDRRKLQEGKTLLEKVRTLNLHKQEKYGSQYASTDAFHSELSQARKRYSRHLKTARLCFEGQRDVQETLQMKGKRKTDLIGWLQQASTFYSSIGSYSADISRYNISREELEQTQAMIEALYASRQQQLMCKGDAQHATRQREDARQDLRVWMSRFRKTARLALQDEPQLLEVLGILVRN